MKTLLVDGNSLLKNSFEPTLNTLEYQKNINGTYLFLYRLRSILDEGRYTHLKVTFDGKESGSLRRLVYPEYKLKRENKKQVSDNEKSDKFRTQKADLIEILQKICPVFEDLKVEADDIISHYVRSKLPEEKITIVTGDFDILQHISKDVEVFYLNKTFKNKNRAIERYEKSEERKNLIIGHKNFKKLFGFPYENIVLLKIFCGDASDEIKNVKGVTENTLFGIIPDLHEKVLTIEEIKSNCLNFLNQKDVLKEDKLFLKERGLHLPTALKACKNIIEGTETIEINQRIIDLSNQEFITNECKESLEASEFLSKNLFKPFDSQGMVNKMTKIGLTEHINLRMKDVKYFFKPFLKTFNLPK